MRKSLLFLFLILFMGLQAGIAQTKGISGKIVDNKGEALPGVSIVIKGTTNGTTSHIDGTYKLQVPNNSILVFSFIGMTKKEVAIAGRSIINMTMLSDTKDLDEVVVVGYGTQTTKHLTTSVASVKSSAIKNVPVANVTQAMQGKMSGVQVSNTSGRPGAPIAINIRGRSSLSASNQPLYVIDGMPMSNESNTNDYIGQGVSPMANINPDDIESIDVLKDAAAAAIYGSRGSNGVVLITTKKGARNKSNITFSTYFGIQSPVKKLSLLDASDYRRLVNEASIAGGGKSKYTDDQILNPGANTKWLDEIQKNSPKVQNYQFSSSGGNDKT